MYSNSNNACRKSVLVSDPHTLEAVALKNASIVGTQLAGCVLHAMEFIMACIWMVLPFAHAMWTKHNKDISIKACEEAKNSCITAAEHLHIVMRKTLDEVLDVVTADGTWQKRGRLLFLVLLWLLFRNLGKYWHRSFFLSTVWLASWGKTWIWKRINSVMKGIRKSVSVIWNLLVWRLFGYALWFEASIYNFYWWWGF